MDTPQTMAQACANKLWQEDEASRALGMSIEALAPALARLTMTVTPAMVNGHGTCHGGYLFTLADSAFAFACNTVNQRSVGQQAAITYIAPAYLGDKLTASAEEVSRSPRSGIYDVKLTNQEGTLLAVFRGHSRTVKDRFFDDVINQYPEKVGTTKGDTQPHE